MKTSNTTGRTIYDGRNLDRGELEIKLGDNEELYSDCTSGCDDAGHSTDIIHDDKSFHCDAGDIILSCSVEKNGDLRRQLGSCLWWLEAAMDSQADEPRDYLWHAEMVHTRLRKLGEMIAMNAIENGYTHKSLGVDYDEDK